MDTVEGKIRSAVAHVREKGLSLVSGGFGDGKATCCPLAAVVIASGKQDVSSTRRAALILGVTEDWVRDFTHGFDGLAALAPAESDALLLGAALRAEWQPQRRAA